jgi:hypothetical protein
MAPLSLRRRVAHENDPAYRRDHGSVGSNVRKFGSRYRQYADNNDTSMTIAALVGSLFPADANRS